MGPGSASPGICLRFSVRWVVAHHTPGHSREAILLPHSLDVKSGSQGRRGQQQPSQKPLGWHWGVAHTWERGRVLDEGKGSAGGPLGQHKGKQGLGPPGPQIGNVDVCASDAGKPSSPISGGLGHPGSWPVGA